MISNNSEMVSLSLIDLSTSSEESIISQLVDQMTSVGF